MRQSWSNWPNQWSHIIKSCDLYDDPWSQRGIYCCGISRGSDQLNNAHRLTMRSDWWLVFFRGGAHVNNVHSHLRLVDSDGAASKCGQSWCPRHQAEHSCVPNGWSTHATVKASQCCLSLIYRVHLNSSDIDTSTATWVEGMIETNGSRSKRTVSKCPVAYWPVSSPCLVRWASLSRFWQQGSGAIADDVRFPHVHRPVVCTFLGCIELLSVLAAEAHL